MVTKGLDEMKMIYKKMKQYQLLKVPDVDLMNDMRPFGRLEVATLWTMGVGAERL